MEQVDMNFETYKKCIDSFKNLKHIELQGEGEPFLHSNIFEMIEYAKEKQIKVSMISNGSLFTEESILKIFKSGLDHLMISIESPMEQDFKRITNGDINKVIKGIKTLIHLRRKYGFSKPAIGIIVTVLKSTIHLLPQIVKLYKQLDLDGGISAQGLSKKEFYCQFYDSDLKNEYITEIEYKSIEGFLKEIESNVEESRQHFYHELFSESLKLSNTPNCPWLSKALYINVQGFVTSCCTIKDFKKFTIGNINDDKAEDIISAKNKLKVEFENRNTPHCCIGCPRC
jgi:MoaA/NifB/PqqE/SkfB family radical SAM enzyme